MTEIVTSGSKHQSWHKCARLRWWEYEAPSGDGGTRGWEPKKLNLPLSTGGWCHKIVEGLLRPQIAGEAFDIVPVPESPAETIAGAVEGYRLDVQTRGIELGLSLDGAVAEEKFLERTIAEQAALIEAFGWAFVRVRLPRLLEEYEVLSVEREEATLLAGDVLLQSRCDAVLRRRSDGLVFVYNLKTSKDPHRKSWQEQWQFEQQMMTEVLAVERRLGERVYGVIVDGFDKGERVTCWWHSLREVREGYSKPPAEGDEKWQRQRSRLLYGYKCEDIPGRPTLYDFEGTTRKGWGPFAVWEESGFRSTQTLEPMDASVSPVEYWINWLPIEQVESAFVTLPPVPRLDQYVDAKVRQIVSKEREIYENAQMICETNDADSPEQLERTWQVLLDSHFPQSSGFHCQFCAFKRVCWEDVEPSQAPDLYQPRTSNHPELGEEL